MRTIKKFLPGSKRHTESNVLDLSFVRTLGTGSFGRVFLAKHPKTGEVWAVKRLKKKAIVDQRQVAHVMAEKDVLARIEHPFAVNFVRSHKDDRYLYIVLEFVPGGEFFTYLQKVNHLGVEQFKFYAAQIVTFFEYIHSMDIVYRDLKPENLLIGQDGYLKVTDFGFAKVVVGRTYTLCGTPEYLAPEIILNQGHGKPADWWALGIFIYEMHVGRTPFSGDTAMALYSNIIQGHVTFPTHFDHATKSLVRRLLQKDLSRRYGNLSLGAKSITSHRFFEGFNWEALLDKTAVPPYLPPVKSVDDTSCFVRYAESDDYPPLVTGEDDPFDGW